MNTEQNVRLNFLEEAEDYLDSIESTLLNLSETGVEPTTMDKALRAAHSLKGGAATMGFTPMSKIAHRLEDFFKILRVRPDYKTVSEEIEAQLLNGLDCLRKARDAHRQGLDINEEWLAENSDPIFAILTEQLGELTDRDENALLIQDEGNESALLVFEGGAGAVLEELATQLETLSGEQLRQEVSIAAVQLTEYGRMAQAEQFVALCGAIQQQIEGVPVDRFQSYATRALELWERGQAMVLLGQSERLKGLQKLAENISAEAAEPASPSSDRLQLESGEFPEFDTDFSEFSLDETVTADINDIQSAFADLDADLMSVNFDDLADDILDLAPGSLDLDAPLSGDASETSAPASAEGLGGAEAPAVESAAESSDSLVELLAGSELASPVELEATVDELASALDISSVEDLAAELVVNSDVLNLESAPEANVLAEVLTPADDEDASIPETYAESQPFTLQLQDAEPAPQTGGMVRVPIDGLRQTNTLFGKLILERNAINLRLKQVLDIMWGLQGRLQQLEESNSQLRKWYDRASMEGVISNDGAERKLAPVALSAESDSQPQASTLLGAESLSLFDALELDRYSDLHLLSQAQMETVVQLQEVATDASLMLREMSQSTSELNQTTRSLQRNLNRMQMRPFADIVKRFPRLIRDLSRQYDKPVKLQIEGESTLIDRSMLDRLSDPLMHLVRNAFDHGIESSDARQATGKSATGRIRLSATNRGNSISIAIGDDGKGIDLDKIRARALKMGLPDEYLQQCSEQELLELIFESGFSTTERVTELSGRGVGMDVVKTNIAAMNGSIRIDTQPGQGTTFLIDVPFATSVLRVMLLEAAGMVFAVPAEMVKTVVDLQDNQPHQTESGEVIPWEEGTIPLIRLEDKLRFPKTSKLFAMEGSPKVNRPTAAIFHQYESLGGVCLQAIWGEQEVATTAIQSPVKLPPGFESSTILGDGRVIPLVDPVRLLQWIKEESADLTAAEEESVTDDSDIADSSANSILLVDDSINVRRFLAATLEKSGYQVEQAKDGQEALDMLQKGLSVRAVISDIEMPRMDGYGLLSELRSSEQFEQLPIAMLTSRSNEKHRKLAMQLGASAYLTKPYTEQELLSTVSELCSD